MGDHSVLFECIRQAGMGESLAKAVLDSDEYVNEVCEREQWYQRRGIHSVPAVIINDTHLISGGQTMDVFLQALRCLAQDAAAIKS